MKMKNGKSAAKQIEMKPIAGWEGLYEITEDGKVYSLKRNIFLKPRLSMDGYNRVCLCKDKFRREYRVARLVAETFLEKPIDKTQVNHKDYNRQNDTMDNLEWVTPKENSQYKEHNKIYKCDIDNNIIETFNSIRDAAKSVKGDNTAISKCCRNIYSKTNIYKGFKWKYDNNNFRNKYNNI